jgi:hypothetical protein
MNDSGVPHPEDSDHFHKLEDEEENLHEPQ